MFSIVLFYTVYILCMHLYINTLCVYIVYCTYVILYMSCIITEYCIYSEFTMERNGGVFPKSPQASSVHGDACTLQAKMLVGESQNWFFVPLFLFCSLIACSIEST